MKSWLLPENYIGGEIMSIDIQGRKFVINYDKLKLMKKSYKEERKRREKRKTKS